jgi:lactoylglutathione lyase
MSIQELFNTNTMKKLFLTLTLVLFIAYVAQGQTANFKFNHLALSVKDLNAAVGFYKKVFLLPEITNRTANPSIRWISMNDGKELHLILSTEPITINKSVHIAFSTANLEDFQKRLTELKIPYGDWAGKANAVTIRADGIKQIYFQDPDGYWLEVNNATK